MKKIHMVDVIGQYKGIKNEVDQSVIEVIESGMFVNGPAVKNFQANLENYLGVKHVIPCANGTDALQIALMALGLQPGDEVLVPSFTFVATAEVIGLLGLQPVMIDVDPGTFNVNVENFKGKVSDKTKAIVPVHLFGQSADMEEIMEFAKQHNLYVVEDNAQAIGADCILNDGTKQKAGTIGDIGCTSFYPSKNLGCYGDGGAIFTNDDVMAEKIRIITNHGMNVRYYHDRLGVNSRLDSIQACILDIKLKRLDEYNENRRKLADAYDAALSSINGVEAPQRSEKSTHVFHQYTMKIENTETREGLQNHLKERNIPSMIYYPVPLHHQKAYAKYHDGSNLPVTEDLCSRVLSLPMHSEMDEEGLDYIIEGITSYFK